MNRRDLLGLPLAAAAISSRAQSSPRFIKGICSIIFPKEMPRAECFAEAKSAGFDAIELAVGTDLSLDVSHDDARRLADAAEKVGIRIATLWVSEPLHQNPLNAPDPAVRARGVEAIHRARREMPIAARTTVQRENYQHLRETAQTAKALGLESISFLAVDLTSQAFNRPEPWTAARQAEVALMESDLTLLDRELEALISEWGDSRFLRESPQKLKRIALHFRAHLGLAEPAAPPCNAPWISAVVEADGTVRPCFFHAPIGRTNGSSLLDVLNGPQALAFRAGLNIAANPICRRCVCSLYR